MVGFGQPAGGGSVSTGDLSVGLEGLAANISFKVGAWNSFGYETPSAPGCKTIPPLGERTEDAITAGHAAIHAIDRLSYQLHVLRGQLVSELRQDDDIRNERVDRILARHLCQEP